MWSTSKICTYGEVQMKIMWDLNFELKLSEDYRLWVALWMYKHQSSSIPLKVNDRQNFYKWASCQCCWNIMSILYFWLFSMCSKGMTFFKNRPVWKCNALVSCFYFAFLSLQRVQLPEIFALSYVFLLCVSLVLCFEYFVSFVALKILIRVVSMPKSYMFEDNASSMNTAGTESLKKALQFCWRRVAVALLTKTNWEFDGKVSGCLCQNWLAYIVILLEVLYVVVTGQVFWFLCVMFS